MTDRIAEIRARHQEGIRAGVDVDRAYLLAEVERLLAEVERLRAENRILRASLKIDFEAALKRAEGNR